MAALVLCSACRRHVQAAERSCPFCGGEELRAPPDLTAAAPSRWAAAGALALGACFAVSSAACYGAPCIDDDDDGVNRCGGGDGVCGNGVVEGVEACDDGNTSDQDDCTSSCRKVECGDGVVNGREACDGELYCNSDCTDAGPTVPKCGNAILEGGEQCDAWAEGTTKKNNAICDADCTVPECDDGILNLAAGECCEGNLPEFPCDDPDLLDKRAAGDPNWCLCDRTPTGSSASTGGFGSGGGGSSGGGGAGGASGGGGAGG